MKVLHIKSGNEEEHKGTYFTCGTQYMAFESANCFDCLNYRAIDTKEPLCRSKDGEGFGCAITDMFELFQNEMTEEMRQTLIKDYECPMRLTEKQAKLRQNELYKRIRLENEQLKSGLVQGELFKAEEE